VHVPYCPVNRSKDDRIKPRHSLLKKDPGTRSVLMDLPKKPQTTLEVEQLKNMWSFVST
jgi:hypothetical protein